MKCLQDCNQREELRKMKAQKKLLICFVLVIVVILGMTTIAFASMPAYYSKFTWSSQFGTNRVSNYDSRETLVIQRALNSAMASGLTADGIFGSGTEAKVKQYQSIRSLTSDGIVGPATWQDWQSYLNWSARRQFSTGRDMYYYEYKTANDSKYNIRHYADGAWYVLHNNGSWYRVN